MNLGAIHGDDALGEAGDLPRGRFAMHDALLGRAGDHRLGRLQGYARRVLVAGGDGLFDFAHLGPHIAAADLVHAGPANGLACGFLRRFGIGHGLVLEGL